MPKDIDQDEDVDLAVLWQSMHDGKHPDSPNPQFTEKELAWMERHGITDQAGLDAYRDERMVAFNIAAGFVLRGKMWLTKAEADEEDAKAAAKEAEAKAAAEKAEREAPQLRLEL